MDKPNTPQLTIDREFRDLIRPLMKDEYRHLEQNLLADGCREPITVWKDIIVDGHNRFEICSRLGIPFEVRERHFDNREEAIIWICANQLGRRNISDETRRYLIGKRYEAEKVIAGRRNYSGWNQYRKREKSIDLPYEVIDPSAGKISNITAYWRRIPPCPRHSRKVRRVQSGCRYDCQKGSDNASAHPLWQI